MRRLDRVEEKIQHLHLDRRPKLHCPIVIVIVSRLSIIRLLALLIFRFLVLPLFASFALD